VSPPPAAVAYLAGVAALFAAVGTAIHGAVPQTVVLAVGAAFLLFWANRQS
jgi:hypothetical protein